MGLPRQLEDDYPCGKSKNNQALQDYFEQLGEDSPWVDTGDFHA